MKVESISITNFQPYYGDCPLKFGDGLNIIIGRGGKGKSKLFNAFYWVLFGKIFITDYEWIPTDGLPLKDKNIYIPKFEFINKKALYEAKKGDTVECAVSLTIRDDQGELYVIERKVYAKRTNLDEWDSEYSWEIGPSELKVSFDTNTGTKVLRDDMAESKIDDLFPAGIREYIWFQGESLDKLIDFTKPNVLKDAVKHISYYPYYEKLTTIITEAKKKIGKMESTHLRSVNKDNAVAKQLLAEIERFNTRLDSDKKKEREILDTIDKMQLKLATDEGKVSGLAEFSEIVTKYNKCDMEINRIMNDMTILDNEERRLLPILWVLRDTQDLIAKSKEIINAHVEEVYTAPEMKFLDNPSRAKLEEILNKDHVCFVCGCPIDEEHQERIDWIRRRIQMQEEFLKEMEEYKINASNSKRLDMLVGRIQDFPDRLLVSLNGIDQQYEKIEEEIENLQAKKHRERKKKEQLEQEIEDIKRRHGVDPRREAESFSSLDTAVKATRGAIERKNRELAECRESIKYCERQIADKRKDLQKTGNQTGVVYSVEETEWLRISEALEKICARVQEHARVELLRKVEQRANDFYVRFTEHDKGYSGRVEIDDSYSIKVDTQLNRSHDDRKKMSIINALLSLNQDAMGVYYPFISDAPTSNFDQPTTHKYLLGIKDVFKQTIVMTKDVVVGSKEYDELFNASNVSRIYELSSHIYTNEDKILEAYEVSTDVERLK